MTGAIAEKITMMDGEFELVKLVARPKNWYFRYWYKGEGGRRGNHLYRSLRTDDVTKAEKLAFEEWRKLKTHELEVGSVTPKTPQDLMDDWLEHTRRRVITGEIQEVTYKSKRYFFTSTLKNYFASKGIKRITDLQSDSFDDFRYWRLQEGWKFSTRSSGIQKPPTDSTINAEQGLIREWYNQYLIPKKYASGKPHIRNKVLERDELSANPPIPRKDWEKYWRYFERWTKEDAKGINRPAVHYWRMCFRHFMLVSYNSGCRPSEICGRYNKQKKRIDRGITWSDVEIVPQTRWSEKLNKQVEDKPVSILNIRETKTKVPREVPCLAAVFLERWKDFVLEWRKSQGLPPPNESDLVFANPKTGKPFAYTMYSKTWRDISDVIQDSLTNQYTLYSARSSYVTNQLEEGVSTDDICLLTGHSYRILRRHYERLQMRKRLPEVTKRRYGMRDENPHGARKLL